MKTTYVRSLTIGVLFAFVLTVRLGHSAQVSMSLPITPPRLLSINSPGSGQVPAINLRFQYDAKGRALCAAGSMIGTNSLTGQVLLVKKVNGAAAYTVTAKGSVVTPPNLTLKGQLGWAVASCIYQIGKQKSSVTNLPVVVTFTSPVTANFTLISQIDSKGMITGTGTIGSGYGNDSPAAGVLSGKLTKSQLNWRLKQGSQQLSFTGKSVSNGFSGALTINLPPARGTIKPFLFPGFSGSSAGSTGVVVTFKGSVSQASSQGEFPSPAAGVTLIVRSDLNGDGTIQTSEQFTTQTDADGNYQLSGKVVDGGRAVLEISFDGYAKELKVIDPIRAGAVVVNKITLRPLTPLSVFGGNASSSDNKLQLQGLPTQIASVRARVFNPITEADHFPGEFADDKTNVLISSVFVAIDARDGSGNSVTNLGGSSTLRMQVPKDTWATLGDLVPGNNQLDQPLYYFDEASGKWVRSANDGWLEDATGAKLAEDQLAFLKNGSYSGTVYVVGPITHLSWWNCDHPISEHTCIHAVVMDTNNAPIAGATVEVKGITYNGITSPKITGADGSFCADVMRSEAVGEDIDGDGITGQTTQVSITVFSGTNYYNFGPYTAPATQATCDEGNCLDLGQLTLSDSSRLSITLCSVTG